MSSRLETKTSFGYMPLYIADYMADTAHLSTLEHGAYLLLIMAYWKTGKALPASDFRLANICHLSIDEWKGIRATIAEFFLVSTDFWTHKRIEKELDHFRVVSEQAKKNRLAGIEKRKAEQAAKQASFLPKPDNGRSTGVEPPPMLDGRSTGVVDTTLQNSISTVESTNATTGVKRALNGRTTTQTQTQTHISNTEVLVNGSSSTFQKNNNGNTQHQSICSAFVEVVGRPMKKIDVELLSKLLETHSDQHIEAGIYIAGIRARELGKKPGSLAYFESEIAKTHESSIGDLGSYIDYLKQKFAKNGHRA